MTTVLSKPKNTIAMEVIDFQDNSFGIQLETIVTSLCDKITKDEYKKNIDILNSDEVDKLTSLIFHRLGIRVMFYTNKALAAILPFYSNKHSIFIDKFFKGDFTIEDQEKILKKASGKKGYVDLAKAKVGGIFSEYENHLHINFKSLHTHYKLTPGEIVSVILHELGHAFHICEYSDRLDTNNQILTDVAVELFSKKKEKNLTYVYTELKKVNKKITEEEVDKLVNGNRVIAGYTWFKVVIEASGLYNLSQMQNAKYDETSFEALSDNFATRFNYGRQLIFGLDKLHSSGFSYEKNRTWMIFIELESLFSFFSVPIFIIGYFGFTVPVFVFTSLVVMFMLYASGEAYKNYTYDELKIRYKRARSQYIEMLKSMDLDKKTLSQIVDNVYKVDDVIKNTYQYSSTINRISNVLFTTNREAINSIKEQQLLEDLAFNDLFLKSAELRTI